MKLTNKRSRRYYECKLSPDLSYEENKKILIDVCRHYSKQKHISSRSSFNDIADNLTNGRSISYSQVNLILKFISYDTSLDINVIRTLLQIFTQPRPKPTTSLEQFF